MYTLLKTKSSFDKEWLWLKRKDEIAIKKVEERFTSNTQFSYNFVNKVVDVYDSFKQQVPHIATVLEEYLDTHIYNAWFDTPFSKTEVICALSDMRFVATLMCNNLLRRTANLKSDSAEQLKLRIYIAILNYVRYKRSKILKKLIGKGKGQRVVAK